MLYLPKALRGLAYRFSDDPSGAVTPIFAFTLLPILLSVGAAFDYGRAVQGRAKLRAALDAAVLAGAKDGSSNWTTTASQVFSAVQAGSVVGASANFSSPSQGSYAGTATGSVPTAFMGIAGFKQIPIQANAKAFTEAPDNSCILTLAQGQQLDHESLIFNGSPNVALTGCTIRSNTSLKCNGHSTGAAGSIAAGTAAGACSNPQSGASVVPDIYKPLASNIVKQCSAWPGATWTPGSIPPYPKVITVNKASYTEHHVCGDLTLSGSGSLTSGSADTVIVIENGSLIVDDKASIQATRVTFVLTGDNTKASSIEFPNGNGKAATLSVTPSVSPDNPWRGVSIYQDPSLTRAVDEDWGPGATLNVDGLVYLPNANVRFHGNPSSNSPVCAKLVVNTFVSNGGVNLNQTAQGCTNYGLRQWAGGSPRIIE